MVYSTNLLISYYENVLVVLLTCFFYFRDEAEMEYLKIAQDLDMYGVNYFPISVCINIKIGFYFTFSKNAGIIRVDIFAFVC